MTTFDEIMGELRLPRLTARVYTRGDLLAETTRLANAYEATRSTSYSDDELGAANSPAAAERDRIFDRLEELNAELEASVVEFEFQALGAIEYRMLQEAHKPRPSDVEAGVDFNIDTFPSALVSACSFDPVMTVDQVDQLFASIHDGEFKKLWSTAIAVNVAEVSAPKFVRRSALEVLGATSSSSVGDTESHGASFSDG